jgi:putative iron-dependent peroxidase
VTEQMLEHMFLGSPPASHDRILDFSTAVAGTLFFVPSADFYEAGQRGRRSPGRIRAWLGPTSCACRTRSTSSIAAASPIRAEPVEPECS